MMQSLTTGDFLRRLRHVGIAGHVQASQALTAFRLYIASEFPQAQATDIEPLFIRQKQLVARSHNPALMQAIKERESDIIQYIQQSTSVRIEQIRFRP